MTCTSLVLDISHMCALVEETGGKALGVCEIASSIVADVNDESLTEHKVDEHLVEIALAHSILKTLVAHIGDIVVEDTLGCPGGSPVEVRLTCPSRNSASISESTSKSWSEFIVVSIRFE